MLKTMRFTLHFVPMVAMALTLAGCTTVDWSAERHQALTVAAAPTDRELDVAALLAAPLTRDDALRIAMVQSPEMRRLWAIHESELRSAAMGGRLANPSFSYERLRSAEGLDIERWVSLGVLDVLTLPQRRRVAAADVEAGRVRLASDIVDRLTAVRRAWVEAVAAVEKRRYAERVLASAEASAELAVRMESAGNFNVLERARQQSYEADARSRLIQSRQQELAARETLLRLLGLNAEQAQRLTLPARLPALPAEPMSAPEVSQAINATRLDLRLAGAEWRGAAAAQGLTRVTSLTDVSLALREQDTRGFEVEISLPVFDAGDLQRGSASARVRAAAAQLEQTALVASSDLRVGYAAYRSAYDDARHHRDVLVPLRRSISEETLLRYNGMLIGVFELLADAREQVDTVIAAIEANERFWLAEAELQASLLGRPGVQ
jgi:outer membrane protein TolC